MRLLFRLSTIGARAFPVAGAKVFSATKLFDLIYFSLSSHYLPPPEQWSL